MTVHRMSAHCDDDGWFMRRWSATLELSATCKRQVVQSLDYENGASVPAGHSRRGAAGSSHRPFRDSKLTQLLQPALDGRVRPSGRSSVPRITHALNHWPHWPWSKPSCPRPDRPSPLRGHQGRVVTICCIATARVNIGETRDTLEFCRCGPWTQFHRLAVRRPQLFAPMTAGRSSAYTSLRVVRAPSQPALAAHSHSTHTPLHRHALEI